MPVDQSLQSWDAHRDDWQEILNERRPGRTGREHRCRIAVVIRVVWERDGEERIESTANAWIGDLVHCDISDRRTRFRGVWLHAGDVLRRPPAVGDEPRGPTAEKHLRRMGWLDRIPRNWGG